MLIHYDTSMSLQKSNPIIPLKQSKRLTDSLEITITYKGSLYIAFTIALLITLGAKLVTLDQTAHRHVTNWAILDLSVYYSLLRAL